jgi:hypothetical protein
MTTQLTLITEPGIGERCLHCQQILTLPNIPLSTWRDGSLWGWLHQNCKGPYALKVSVLYPTRHFHFGA